MRSISINAISAMGIFFKIGINLSVEMGYRGAQVARLLGVSTSAVARAVNSGELPEVENYL